jgi:hypothetical protein
LWCFHDVLKVGVEVVDVEVVAEVVDERWRKRSKQLMTTA